MHAASLMLMDEALNRLEARTAHVLDVGSYDVNGTYREMVERRGWIYAGLDLRAGPNVEIVASDPYAWDLPAASFDAVICGNMLHNTAEFWRLLPEMARVLCAGGLLVLVTISWGWGPAGRHPLDAWRFMDDGIRVLFDLTGCLRDHEIRYGGAADIVGSAFKRGAQ